VETQRNEVETLGKARVKTRCKRTMKTQVKREGAKITNQGKTQRKSLQINAWQRNDPTLIIHAQESRAFESKSLTLE